MKPVLSRDCAVHTSMIAVADSRNELSALRAGLREARETIDAARACIAASLALKAKAERLIEQADGLFTPK